MFDMAPERCVGTSLESLFDQSHGMWIFSRAVTFAQTNINKPVSFTISMRLKRPEKVFCVVVLDGSSNLNQRQMRIYLLKVQQHFSGFLAPEVHADQVEICFPAQAGLAKEEKTVEVQERESMFVHQEEERMGKDEQWGGGQTRLTMS